VLARSLHETGEDASGAGSLQAGSQRTTEGGKAMNDAVRAYLAKIGAMGEAVASEAQKAAARENGKKGGCPPKPTSERGKREKGARREE